MTVNKLYHFASHASAQRWADIVGAQSIQPYQDGANGCRIYISGGDIALVGRPSDAETVRYLYAYLKTLEHITC